MYGYSKVDGAMVADPEKALVDMFYLGMFEEYAEEAIESGKVSWKKLLMFAELSGSKSLVKRVGRLPHAVKERR